MQWCNGMNNKKRILFIQTYQGRNDSRGTVSPLGPGYIATSLAEKGHEVSIFDPNLCENPYEEIKERVRGFVLISFDYQLGISIPSIKVTFFIF